jgi:hypothetical protein
VNWGVRGGGDGCCTRGFRGGGCCVWGLRVCVGGGGELAFLVYLYLPCLLLLGVKIVA